MDAVGCFIRRYQCHNLTQTAPQAAIGCPVSWRLWTWLCALSFSQLQLAFIMKSCYHTAFNSPFVLCVCVGVCISVFDKMKYCNLHCSMFMTVEMHSVHMIYAVGENESRVTCDVWLIYCQSTNLLFDLAFELSYVPIIDELLELDIVFQVGAPFSPMKVAHQAHILKKLFRIQQFWAHNTCILVHPWLSWAWYSFLGLVQLV